MEPDDLIPEDFANSPDDAVIKPGAIDEPHCSLCVFSEVKPAKILSVKVPTKWMRSIVVWISLNEAEAAGSPLKLVQAHDHPLHLAALAEKLVDLLLRCVEAHVAHVERCAIAQERGVNIIPSRCD